MHRLLAPLLSAAAAHAALTVSILTIEGDNVEGATTNKKVVVKVNGTRRELSLDKVLSIHSGVPASASETARIDAGILAIQGMDRPLRDSAVEDLTDLGIPVMTPLLKAYKDTDAHEPRPLYRLFARIIPSAADQLDRSLTLVRLASGEMLRGEIEPADWDLGGRKIASTSVRRVAVRQRAVSRKVDVDSLAHCNQIEYFDTGILETASSRTDSTAGGFTRLSWNTDDWTSNPDGLKKPAGNYKTNLVNGHPFGALVGRLGARGTMFVLGTKFGNEGVGPGRLYLAINDNPHWQNNLGSYRVSLRVTDAYDVGEPR